MSVPASSSADGATVCRATCAGWSRPVPSARCGTPAARPSRRRAARPATVRPAGAATTYGRTTSAPLVVGCAGDGDVGDARWPRSTRSTGSGHTFSPPVMIRSSRRPCTSRRPSAVQRRGRRWRASRRRRSGRCRRGSHAAASDRGPRSRRRVDRTSTPSSGRRRRRRRCRSRSCRTWSTPFGGRSAAAPPPSTITRNRAGSMRASAVGDERDERGARPATASTAAASKPGSTVSAVPARAPG